MDETTLQARVTNLERLIVHCWVHSGYHDCGRRQMDSAQKELYDLVIQTRGGYSRTTDPDVSRNPGYS